MEYKQSDFNQGLAAIEASPDLSSLYSEITTAISSITDSEISSFFKSQKRDARSISEAINTLLNGRLVELGWERQSPIYKDESLSDKTWTLDFAKGIKGSNGKSSGMPVEVVFNHGEAIAWNLIKLSLASENSVQKRFQFSTSVGIYICATREMKNLGGFDGAIGEYERVLKYLDPLDQKIIKPLVVIGLLPPSDFKILRYASDYHVVKNRGRSTGELQELL